MTDIGHIITSPSTSSTVAPGRLEETAVARDTATDSLAPTRNLKPSDRVEISEHARHLARIKAMPEFRPDRVRAARAAIESGSLDNTENLMVALEHMIEDSRKL